MDLSLPCACSHVPMSVTLHSYNEQLLIYLHRLKGTRTHYKEHSPLGSCQDATTTAAHQQPFLSQSLAWYYILDKLKRNVYLDLVFFLGYKYMEMIKSVSSREGLQCFTQTHTQTLTCFSHHKYTVCTENEAERTE